MPRHDKKDISLLYPTPKRFDEIEAERELRQLERRPRFVAAKMGAWTTLGVATAVVTYQIVSYLMTHNISSMGDAMFGAATSILVGLMGLVALFYFYSLTNTLAKRALASTTLLYIVFILIFIVEGFVLTAWSGAILAVIAVLFFNFLAACFVVNFIVKRSAKY